MLMRNQNNHTRRNKIFLIDDHPIVRQGLTMLIDREADLEVCGDAPGASSALSALSAQKHSERGEREN